MTKYMTSVDLNYAYVTTPIALEDSKYLHFFWQVKLLWFVAYLLGYILCHKSSLK